MKVLSLPLLCIGLVLCACLPATAGAQLTATLHTSFSPDRLGASTTIGFSFELSSTEGLAPPPLSQIDLHMPGGMNYTVTTLGLAVCTPQTLAQDGAKGCPPNSRLGSGTAFVEVPFGTGSGRELPTIEAFMGPPEKGNMVVLFYANGQEPVFAQLIFTGELLPEPGAGGFGADLSTAIPPIPSVPNGPNVSIVRVAASLGPEHLTYYRHLHGGKLQAFHPVGIALPEKCPGGGFPFSADFTFSEGSHVSASSTVPCPRAHAVRRR